MRDLAAGVLGMREWEAVGSGYGWAKHRARDASVLPSTAAVQEA
jgi:hypothetical protein